MSNSRVAPQEGGVQQSLLAESGEAESEDTPCSEQEEDERICTPDRIAVLVILVVIVSCVVADSICCGNLLQFAKDLTHWVSSAGILGVVLCAGVRAMCIVLFLPAWPVLLAAAAAFSKEYGQLTAFFVSSASVFAADVVATQLMFFIGRFMLERPMRRLMKKNATLYWLDKAIEHKGLRICFLARMNPEFITVASYGFGATHIHWSDYTIGTLGDLVGVFGYSYIGVVLGGGHAKPGEGSGRQSAAMVKWIVLGASVLITVVLVILITHQVKKEMEVIALEERQRTHANLGALADSGTTEDSREQAGGAGVEAAEDGRAPSGRQPQPQGDRTSAENGGGAGDQVNGSS
uniref:VTT domain-containing protein n=1 Tax=Chromera velia CCMP2878 TaxID=1169474 RepID=A0A0G4FET5_9ALVE|eukprot:Cvel_16501.t1-p1 / transcript=Cvel_16501.t1 / gene=Cvel_16501 / organism=Chromera_velia_CCMP2878 / gene_product=TVP38/TMEM64 family membrane protein slr0305, putative / transcript_product=TVP38/TMEM64 family membrane protein slr0305, putative / location=Cvel_scaffold1272:42075-45725(+) / protein_length=348 / sequence_SO=supercontig / SO=protein_coding / is_pseudo=false